MTEKRGKRKGLLAEDFFCLEFLLLFLKKKLICLCGYEQANVDQSTIGVIIRRFYILPSLPAIIINRLDTFQLIYLVHYPFYLRFAYGQFNAAV